jgi:hypothetical protein
MDTKHTIILNNLRTVSKDRHDYLYFSVNTGVCTFKVDGQHLDKITQHRQPMHDGNEGMYYQIPHVYEYLDGCWVKKRFAWLHSICDIYTMEETTAYEWGETIDLKRHYSVYRFALFKLLIKSYLNGLRHRVWQPRSLHVARLKLTFLEHVKRGDGTNTPTHHRHTQTSV